MLAVRQVIRRRSRACVEQRVHIGSQRQGIGVASVVVVVGRADENLATTAVVAVAQVAVGYAVFRRRRCRRVEVTHVQPRLIAALAVEILHRDSGRPRRVVRPDQDFKRITDDARRDARRQIHLGRAGQRCRQCGVEAARRAARRVPPVRGSCGQPAAARRRIDHGSRLPSGGAAERDDIRAGVRAAWRGCGREGEHVVGLGVRERAKCDCELGRLAQHPSCAVPQPDASAVHRRAIDRGRPRHVGDSDRRCCREREAEPRRVPQRTRGVGGGLERGEPPVGPRPDVRHAGRERGLADDAERAVVIVLDGISHRYRIGIVDSYLINYSLLAARWSGEDSYRCRAIRCRVVRFGRESP